MLISHKRAFLAGCLQRSGLLKLLDRAARRPGLLVLGYHRIGIVDGDPFYPGVFSASPDAFARQLSLLRDRFKLLSLDDLIALGPDLDVREPCALITFDDGYRDNLDVALPILLKLGIPATFFLPTDFLDRPHLFWWDRLAAILHQRGLAPRHPEVPVPFDETSIDGTLESEVAACLAAHPDEIAGRLDRLSDRAGVSIDEHELGRSLLIDWDGARALIAAGMAVGSHSKSHRNLARLDQAVQREELAGSKAAIEAKLGREATAIAYPYGVASAYTDFTCRLASEVGYRVGFGFAGGINRPGATSAYAIERINVGYSDTPGLLRARTSMLSAFGRSIV